MTFSQRVDGGRDRTALAADLGKRLLEEVEVVEFGEILSALRVHNEASSPRPSLGHPPLDKLLQATSDGPAHTARPASVVELMSLHAGGGATHLLYQLTALAAISRDRNGMQSCAVIIDTDGHFDLERLVTQICLVADHDQSPDKDGRASNSDVVVQALRHVHIFRPQSLASLTATLESLTSYLLNGSRHFSFDRPVSFIAIESASAFHWQDRAETEDAEFHAKTSGEPNTAAPQSRYGALTTALKRACSSLQCPAIFTSWHLDPVSATPHSSRSLRPSLPAPFSALPTLRLACRRIPVKKFPPLISVDGAQREANDRQRAIEEGSFEWFVNEWGVDERTLRKTQDVGHVFQFKIFSEGVVVKE